MKFKVKIRGTITKVLEIDAEDESKATEQAHEQFSTDFDGEETYNEEILNIEKEEETCLKHHTPVG